MKEVWNMNMDGLLKELHKGNYNIFQYNKNICHLALENEFEILIQLSNHSVLEKRMELLKHILQNYETYMQKAVRQLKAFHIDIGENYFTYGIYVGEFNFGSHGFHVFDGFTISLKKDDSVSEDEWNLDVYTVQFKSDGHPLGIDLWFE